jgi:hypothetical protein
MSHCKRMSGAASAKETMGKPTEAIPTTDNPIPAARSTTLRTAVNLQWNTRRVSRYGLKLSR